MASKILFTDMNFNSDAESGFSGESTGADYPQYIGNCSYSTCAEFIPQNNVFLSVLSVNSRSLRKNFFSLSQLLYSIPTRPNIIAITETWLQDGDEMYLAIPNYNFVSSPRPVGRGGGVGIYLEDNLDFSEVSYVKQLFNTHESISVEISRINGTNIIVTCLYRPPDTNAEQFNTEFELLLSSLKVKNKMFILAGDYNLNLFNVHKDCHISEYFNIAVSHGLYPTVTKPTRVTKSSATLIDNVYVNILHYPIKSTIFLNDLSDHFPLFVEFSCMTKPHRPVRYHTKRCYDRTSIAHFSNLLEYYDWTEFNMRCSFETDTSKLYDEFFVIISVMYNVAFPEMSQRQSKAGSSSHP